MRFPNISLLLITSLGLTQALVIPVPEYGSALYFPFNQSD